jgi:hypothetical protein
MEARVAELEGQLLEAEAQVRHGEAENSSLFDGGQPSDSMIVLLRRQRLRPSILSMLVR